MLGNGHRCGGAARARSHCGYRVGVHTSTSEGRAPGSASSWRTTELCEELSGVHRATSTDGERAVRSSVRLCLLRNGHRCGGVARARCNGCNGVGVNTGTCESRAPSATDIRRAAELCEELGCVHGAACADGERAVRASVRLCLFRNGHRCGGVRARCDAVHRVGVNAGASECRAPVATSLWCAAELCEELSGVHRAACADGERSVRSRVGRCVHDHVHRFGGVGCTSVGGRYRVGARGSYGGVGDARVLSRAAEAIRTAPAVGDGGITGGERVQLKRAASADRTIAGEAAEHRSVASGGRVGEEGAYHFTCTSGAVHIGLHVVALIGERYVDLEGEHTIRGELADQYHVGTGRVDTRLVRQRRPSVVHHGQHVAIDRERVEIHAGAQVVGQRWGCAGNASVVTREVRIDSASGEVAVGVQVAADTQLLGSASATGGSSGDAGGTHGDVAVEGRSFVDTTRLAGHFATEVVIVPERRGRADRQGVR